MGIGTSFNEGGMQQSSLTNKLVALYRRPEQGQTTTPGTHCPTLFELCVVSFTSPNYEHEKLRDGAYGLSSLSEKTRESKNLRANDQGRVIIILLTF